MLGFYDADERLIAIRSSSALQEAKTLAHELADHFADDRVSTPEPEPTAESTAYMVLARFGLDSGARSFPYIATWAQDKTLLKNALGVIQTHSSRQIDRLVSQADAGIAVDTLVLP